MRTGLPLTEKHRRAWTAWVHITKLDPALRQDLLRNPSEDFMVPASAALASHVLLRRLRFSEEESAENFEKLVGRPVARVAAFYYAVRDLEKEEQMRMLDAFARKYEVSRG
ncbi:hypothetical protein [Rubrobacter calidifluminis]|uniref:hypothetical protein n=1 Tax=Rubrobacter calidifluminis TaxID=1392640 RepID=UPI0023607210|nr:hypothetical protein [Rubrobacter calidifluminis]